jgi:hypothetical protein
LIRLSTERLQELFDLICSFPLLDDLHLERVTTGPYADERTVPLTSPKFCESLFVNSSFKNVIRALLNLPGGLHFTKIRTRCSWEGGTELVADLVMRCSSTLESLFVDYYMLGMFPSASAIDRSSYHPQVQAASHHSRSISPILQN